MRWLLIILLLLVGCTSPLPEFNMSAFGISAITTDRAEYSPTDLVNISVMVRDEALLNYTVNITLFRDGQVDYTQSSFRDNVSRPYERWNIWKEMSDGGNWTVLIELQPQNSLYVVNASTMFVVK
ncbi:MAG: hypothetical protein Q7R56_03055 [Nanoarchaeota archaeon]|nr:hypothetical protein [Nanoarchaeota archaeon]